MRSSRRLLACVLTSALAFAACGDDGDDTATGGTGGDGGDLAGQTVEVAAVWTGAEQANFRLVLDRFEEETGATAEFTSTGDDIATVLGTRLDGGDPPDVAVLPQPGLMGDLAERGALQPLSEDAGQLVDENFAPVWRDLGSVDGTLYGVWFKAANKSTVWYNVGVFEDAGVEPPETWDEFLTTARTITDSGVPAVSIGGGDGWTLTDWFENIYLRVAGAEKYDQLAAHEIPWTDPTVVQSLAELQKLWSQKNLLGPNPTSTPFPQSVSQVFAEPPAAAIVYEGDFVAGVITDETDAALGEDADFFPFPSVGGSAPAVVGGGDVAVALTDEPAAAALIEFLAGAEAAEVWAEAGGFTSPNQNVDAAVYPDDIARKSAGALVEAETFRFDLSDLQPAAFGGTPSQGMWKILQDFLANPSDPTATAQQLETAAAAAFG